MEKKNIHIMYGFITGVVMVIISLILYITGLSFKTSSAWMANLVYVVFLLGMILNGISFSKANDGYVTFGKVFRSCFRGAMIAIIVMIAWSVISIYLFPDMKDRTIAMIRAKMLENPSTQKLSDEDIDSSLDMIRKHWNTLIIGTSIVYHLFFGALFSLIGAAVAKKKGENPFKTMDVM